MIPVNFTLSAVQGTDHELIVDIAGGDYSNRDFQLRFEGDGWGDVTGAVSRVNDDADTRIVFTMPGFGVGLRAPMSFQIWMTDYPRQVLAAGNATVETALEAEL